MLKTLLGATALAGLLVTGAAHAGTMTFGDVTVTATNATGSTTSPFALGDFGNSGIDGLVSTNSVFLNNGVITFTNATNPQAGVYDGNVANVSASPFNNTGLAQRNYLVAEPNDPVNIVFNAALNTFSLLWGTVDTYNSLNLEFLNNGMVSGTSTISGSQVAQAGGFSASGSNPAYVTLSRTASFNQVRITSNTAAFEFVPSVQVPEPASIALLGMGLAGIGLVRRKKAGAA